MLKVAAMRDGTFEAYGSRDYEYIEGEGWTPTEPATVTPTPEYEKDISQLKQDVSQLKAALKSIMDLLGRHVPNNHPLYQDYK